MREQNVDQARHAIRMMRCRLFGRAFLGTGMIASGSALCAGENPSPPWNYIIGIGVIIGGGFLACLALLSLYWTYKPPGTVHYDSNQRPTGGFSNML